MFVSERRRHPRFPTCSHADLRLGLSWCGGKLLDISLRGALFETESAKDGLNGKACRLYISGVVDPINGIVVHSEQGLLGIKFIAISQQAHDALIFVIASSQAGYSLLERDVLDLLKS